MFERYTEKARRVIFFARYEASQYGSSSINTEHILLALLREDRPLMRHLRLDLAPLIRDEIDKVIQRGERVSTSTEMPLSAESQKILNFAGEEAERLGHQHIGTEHILLGILRLLDSLVAKLLMARGAKPNVIREQIAKSPASTVATTHLARGALGALDEFLGLLRAGSSKQAAAFFHDKGQYVDSSGRRWLGRTEIDKGAEILFATFAKRNVSLLYPCSGNSPPPPATAANRCSA